MMCGSWKDKERGRAQAVSGFWVGILWGGKKFRERVIHHPTTDTATTFDTFELSATHITADTYV